jgi:hypothetical protein
VRAEKERAARAMKGKEQAVRTSRKDFRREGRAGEEW